MILSHTSFPPWRKKVKTLKLKGMKERQRLPPWLKIRQPWGLEVEQTRDILHTWGLKTVCREARCPNLGECFAQGTATFLILGTRCTRNCQFCSVEHATPFAPADKGEPERLAEAVAALGIRHVVITSVTRDDLPDGGAQHFSLSIRAIKRKNPGVTVEVLVPDFKGEMTALAKILLAEPDILAHNVETVPRLYPTVRPQALYSRSLALLRFSHQTTSTIPVKSGFMVGLGETREEITVLLSDLRQHGVEIVTIGQYLRPRLNLLPVVKFYRPEEFEELETMARSMGFKKVESGPLVRSSYRAERQFQSAKEN